MSGSTMRIASSMRVTPSAVNSPVSTGCDQRRRARSSAPRGCRPRRAGASAGRSMSETWSSRSPGTSVELVLEVLDALEVLGAAAAHHADDLVALRQQELGEIGAVLSGDAGDERTCGHGSTVYPAEARSSAKWVGTCRRIPSRTTGARGARSPDRPAPGQVGSHPAGARRPSRHLPGRRLAPRVGPERSGGAHGHPPRGPVQGRAPRAGRRHVLSPGQGATGSRSWPPATPRSSCTWRLLDHDQSWLDRAAPAEAEVRLDQWRTRLGFLVDQALDRREREAVELARRRVSEQLAALRPR